MSPKRIILIFTSLILTFLIFNPSYAAPCYGTMLPKNKSFSTGLESYTIFKRYLEEDKGKINGQQYFLLLSYGVFDWLSIDLKGGAGNIKHKPESTDQVRYSTNFAGGYGLRVKFLDKNNFRMVFGFQHISVHPKSTHIIPDKNKAILDDWQTSLLASYSFKKFTPYLGTRWSRIDYIHWNLDQRKRIMSDGTKSIGLIAGVDLAINNKCWINLEGQFFDSQALAASFNYTF